MKKSARTCVYEIGYHFVWSTKYRKKVLIGAIETVIKELLQECAKEHGFIIEALEVMPDHCHVFVNAHPKYAPSTLIKLLKGVSARRLFQAFPSLKNTLWKGHLWNASYYVGTAGNLSQEIIKRYIEEQKVG